MMLVALFLEVMRHRKLTIVAERLGITQSAVSHSLRRLREIFDDELFLRLPAGVEPTPRALELEPKLQAILEMAGAAVGREAFDPATARGLVRIAAPDYHSALLAGPLITKLRSVAPHLQLSFLPLVRRNALNALSAGDVDIAIGFFWRLPEGFEGRHLFDDGYVVIARQNHPAIGQRLTLKRYLKAEHLLVAMDGTLNGVVDRILAGQGLSRRVVAAVPFFFTVLSAVSGSDLIATVPGRLATSFARPFALRLLKPPIDIRPYRVSAVWHSRNAHNPMTTWLVDQVSDYQAGKN